MDTLGTPDTLNYWYHPTQITHHAVSRGHVTETQATLTVAYAKYDDCGDHHRASEDPKISSSYSHDATPFRIVNEPVDVTRASALSTGKSRIKQHKCTGTCVPDFETMSVRNTSLDRTKATNNLVSSAVGANTTFCNNSWPAGVSQPTSLRVSRLYNRKYAWKECRQP
jgi:hypothetical protein